MKLSFFFELALLVDALGFCTGLGLGMGVDFEGVTVCFFLGGGFSSSLSSSLDINAEIFLRLRADPDFLAGGSSSLSLSTTGFVGLELEALGCTVSLTAAFFFGLLVFLVNRSYNFSSRTILTCLHCRLTNLTLN